MYNNHPNPNSVPLFNIQWYSFNVMIRYNYSCHNLDTSLYVSLLFPLRSGYLETLKENIRQSTISWSWSLTARWTMLAGAPWVWETNRLGFRWIVSGRHPLHLHLWRHSAQHGVHGIQGKFRPRWKWHLQPNCHAIKKGDFANVGLQMPLNTNKWFHFWQWLHRNIGEIIWFEGKIRGPAIPYNILFWWLSKGQVCEKKTINML